MSNAETETVKIRRAPKFIPFALTGLALGAVIAIVLSLTIDNPDGKTPLLKFRSGGLLHLAEDLA
jgi:hypothetical protein